MAASGASGLTIELVTAATAATAVLAKQHGREALRRILDRRRHPARKTRIALAAGCVAGTATLGAAFANAAPPAPPAGWTVDLSEYGADDAAPTLVLYDPIPSRPPPEPSDFSYASPW